MPKRPGAYIALLAALPLLLGACTGGGDETLTIYSGREEDLVAPLFEQFTDDTGIEVDVRYGDSADLALLIEEEGDNTPADVFFSQAPGAVGFLNEAGRLAALETDAVDDIPEGFRSDDGRWVGVTARQRVLVYNEDLVSEGELPDSVYDLTSGRYAGRVAVAPTNGSFQDFVTAMALIEGEDSARAWLKAMAEADAPTYADNSSIVDAVARGEVPMGLVNHYYNYRFLDEDPTLPSRNYVFPNGDMGSLLIASTVSVLAPSDEEDAARRFVEFLLSPEAQEYFATETFEYPLVEGVPPSGDVPPFDAVVAPDFDIDRLGGGLQRTTELIAESGLL